MSLASRLSVYAFAYTHKTNRLKNNLAMSKKGLLQGKNWGFIWPQFYAKYILNGPKHHFSTITLNDYIPCSRIPAVMEFHCLAGEIQ